MASYFLFNETIKFSDAAERFYDIYYLTSIAASAAESEFMEWYKKCGNISDVLNGYVEQASDLILKYAVVPMYDELVHLGIYDVSQERYGEECFVIEESLEAFEAVAEKYNAIVSAQEEKVNYRAQRKAGRARVIGGGFGVSGAVKGMATAGVMNAASGLGHSLVNAIGNAASSMAASSSKRALYQNGETPKYLVDGIKEDIISSYSAHVILVNKKKPNYFYNAFDIEKSVALFESAKKVDNKRQALLYEAFVCCPWYSELLIYIFTHYPGEMDNVWEIGKRFHVELQGALEDIFTLLHTEKAKESEQAAREVRQEIRSVIKELGIPSSATLDRMEIEGISEILSGYEQADESQRREMFAKLEKFDASQQNKAVVIREKLIWELAQDYHVDFSKEEVEKILSLIYSEKAKTDEAEALKAKAKMKVIMAALKVEASDIYDSLETDSLNRLCIGYKSADEASCKEMIQKINSYEGEKRNKTPIIKKIKKRIESIHEKNEEDYLNKIFQSTNIRDPQEVAKTKKLIEKNPSTHAIYYGRILDECNQSNIRKAKLCHSAWGKFCKGLGTLLILLGVAMLFVKVGILLRVVAFSSGGFFGYIYYGYYKAWNDLTQDGTIVHHMLR